MIEKSLFSVSPPPPLPPTPIHHATTHSGMHFWILFFLLTLGAGVTGAPVTSVSQENPDPWLGRTPELGNLAPLEPGILNASNPCLEDILAIIGNQSDLPQETVSRWLWDAAGCSLRPVLRRIGMVV